MVRNIGIFVCFLTLLVLSGPSAMADDTLSPRERARTFVQGLTDRLYTLIEDQTQSEAQKRETLSQLITENVNIDALARILLAQEYRQNATSSQIESYDNLSKKYVLDLFVSRIGELGKRRLTIVDATPTRRGDVVVRTHLKRNDGSLVDVDWRVRDRGGKLRVINFSANGVSLVVTKRAEFSSIAENDGFDALLKVMRDSITVGGTESP